MPEIFAVPRGTDFDFPITAVDPDTGQDFLIDNAATLTSKVWLGDDLAALFTPALLRDRAVGDTAPTANLILRILKTDTTALQPGDYKAQGYADDGVTYKALFSPDGIILRITPNPGTAVARTAWINWDEVVRYSEVAGVTLGSRADQYGFLEQRADATEELKCEIIERAKLRPGFTRRRRTTYHEVFGYDVPTSETPPTKDQIRAALDSNRLKLDSDAKEMLACISIRRILGDNLTENPRTNPYEEHVGRLDTRYRELFHEWEAILDMNGDSAYDLALKVDATYLGDP